MITLTLHKKPPWIRNLQANEGEFKAISISVQMKNLVTFFMTIYTNGVI